MVFRPYRPVLPPIPGSSMAIRTIHDVAGQTEPADHAFDYQQELTAKLDGLDADVDQGVLNEIVLWKVNRYPVVDADTLALLNGLPRTGSALDEARTTAVVERLNECRGFRLPMISTVLRFVNPHTYQILDQRVYRLLTGETYKEPTRTSEKASLYLTYLRDLRVVCERYGVGFDQADRVFYNMDRRLNKGISLNNYGGAAPTA